MTNKLHKRLVISRKTTSFTQKELAEKLGIAESTMNNYEQGKRIPDSETLRKIVEILQCDPTWLLTGKKSSKISANSLENGSIVEKVLDSRVRSVEQLGKQEDMEDSMKNKYIQLLEEKIANLERQLTGEGEKKSSKKAAG